MAVTFEMARWLRDLIRFLPLKAQFVLSGNVRDLQAVEISEGAIAPQGLLQTISGTLRNAGYAHVFVYDPLAGIRTTAAGSPSDGSAILETFGLTVADGRAAVSIDLLGTILEQFVAFQGEPIALIVDFASRLSIRTESLNPTEHNFFTRALVLSHQSRSRPAGATRAPFYNVVIWIVEKEGDLPDWLLVDNPRIRHIPVGKPDHVVRRSLAPALLRPLGSTEPPRPEMLSKAIDEFVDGTEGLLLLDLNAIAILARVEGVPIARITDAVRRYKVGVSEDPWMKIDQNRIRTADAFIQNRVKGQVRAVTHLLDIVKRAVTGVGTNRRGNRPRGVVFLAGPTGVGKTELAKTITTLLFGDESAYIRFDMSEFSAEHSDQRLIGAPPGYVGYDVGGELTNAVREKPFSVLLFDEIEKAHPRILDKFLQVLDDGVLTSGRGDRVYFSETLIIFTSNLGIYRLADDGTRLPNVTPQDEYDEVQKQVLTEIGRHFKLVLNRPEILNRIGENIIVFDFIRPEVATQIYEQMVGNVLADLRIQGYEILLSGDCDVALRRLCLGDLANGGRGIRNQVEAKLLNPLARSLFDMKAMTGDRFEILSIDDENLVLKKT